MAYKNKCFDMNKNRKVKDSFILFEKKETLPKRILKADNKLHGRNPLLW